MHEAEAVSEYTPPGEGHYARMNLYIFSNCLASSFPPRVKVNMNVSLANKILKLTPQKILHPETTAPSLDTQHPLSTGTTIPAVGLMTWKPESEIDKIKNAVLLAIKSGYRSFDTNSRNEAEVGRAIREAITKGSVKREDLFVATTIGNDYGDVEESLDESLKRLGLDYVDLVLTSTPEAWENLARLPSTNKTKSIGVVDLALSTLETLASSHSIPAAIRIPLNPFQQQRDLVALCKRKNIHIIAYSPFRSSTRGSMFNNEVVTKIADKHSIVPENVLLSWQVAKGYSVLVDEPILGGSEGHRKLTLLDDEDMAALDGLASSDP